MVLNVYMKNRNGMRKHPIYYVEKCYDIFISPSFNRPAFRSPSAIPSEKTAGRIKQSRLTKISASVEPMFSKACS